VDCLDRVRSSNSLVVTLLPALVYSTGQTLRVEKNTQISSTNPESSMLTDFTAVGTITGQQLQNEFAHTLAAIRILAGTDDFSTISDINQLDGDAVKFNSTTSEVDIKGYKLINVAVATNPTDGVNKSYVDSADSNLQSQITANAGNISTNASNISSLQTNALQKTTGVYDAGNVKIVNLAEPTNANDAARLKDVQATAATGLPPQLENTGKFLQTDGAVVSWQYLQNLNHFISFNTPLGTANKVLEMMQGYNWYSDNVGSVTGTTRLWLDAPSQGEVHIGPRAGADLLDTVRLRTEKLRLANTLNTVDLAPTATGLSILGNEAWHDGNVANRVTTAEIADNAVTTTKIADTSVLYGKLNTTTYSTTLSSVAGGTIGSWNIGTTTASSYPLTFYVGGSLASVQNVRLTLVVDGGAWYLAYENVGTATIASMTLVVIMVNVV